MYYPENLSDAELRQHIGELREKYMTTDANLQNLKAISRRALVCFETLKKEYAESQQSVSTTGPLGAWKESLACSYLLGVLILHMD
jgi:DNA replication protein DnaC